MLDRRNYRRGEWCTLTGNDDGLAFIGSPDAVIRKREAQPARLGYDVSCAHHQIRDMPKPQVQKSTELFGNM
jgi:hypothetical protein